MGPHLICDKSSLESLNPAELGVLRRYYTLHVPPVLLMEILADLTKQFKNKTPREHVVNLANRIVRLCSTVCLSFRDLVDQELSGSPLSLRGVPVIAAGTPVVAADGQSGMRIEESPEETALLRWQSGSFIEAEEMTATIWRNYIESIQLDEAQRRLRTQYPGLPRCKTLTEVAQLADAIIIQAKRDDL